MNYATTAYVTENLGDVVQTMVMSTVVGPSIGLYRSQLPAVNWHKFDATYVVNGWFDDPAQFPPPMAGKRCFFTGFHTRQGSAAEWCRNSPWPVGARDPDTADLLRTFDVPATVVGCPTLLIPRFDGPRNGALSVDFPSGPGEHLTHRTSSGWPEAWRTAAGRLDAYRLAAEVHTTRLHVALPCLAMGTPVRLVPPQGHDARFSLWHWFGLPVDELVVVDLRPFLRPLLEHLELFLGRPPVVGPPVIPTFKKSWWDRLGIPAVAVPAIHKLNK